MDLRAWLRSAAAAGSTIALFAAAPAGAEDFNPYQALQAGQTLDELVPVIEREIGPISDRDYMGETFFDQPSSGPALLVVVLEPHAGGRYPAYFLFCEEVLAGFAAPVSQAVAFAMAEEIGSAETAGDDASPDNDPSHGTARLADDSLRVGLADGETALIYYDLGTADMRIEATHPFELFRTLDFYHHCVGDDG